VDDLGKGVFVPREKIEIRKGEGSIGLAAGACEQADEGRAELAGGERVEGAEARGEFGYFLGGCNLRGRILA
jgi:hypothetical protein